MVGVHTRINVGDYSRTAQSKNTLSLRHANNLDCWLVHVPVSDAVAVIVDRGRVPKALGRCRRTRLIGVVWRNHQSLIGFGVKYSVDEPKESRKELRQKSLDGLDQENLVHVAIKIANHRTAVGKASKLQPSKTEIRSNDDSRLRTEGVGQDLLDI